MMSFKTVATLVVASILFANGVEGATIRSPSHHAHFTKRTNIPNKNSGSCLSAASNNNGAAVTIGACSSAAAFSWTLPSSGSGSIKLYSNMCLDVTDGKNVNGNKLQIWTCTGGPNQQFTFTNGQLQWKGSNKCVDITDGNHAAGTHVQLWQCFNGNTNQMWTGPASTSTAVSTSSGGGVNFKSKIGLAYPDNSASELGHLSKAGMWYNWNPHPGSLTSTPGITYLPQLWGWDQKSEFDAMAKTSSAELFLGMNECNEPGQSNMDPYSGISLWKQSMKPLRDKGKKLCSPAMSGNPNGLTWMKTFSQACGSDCDFDYTCVHWYDTTFEKFQSWVTTWHNMYPNAPILITEFAPQNFNNGPQPNSGEVWNFYQQAIPWAKAQPWIHGIFPYGFMKNLNINGNAKLMNEDGSLNDLGNYIMGQA